VAKKTKKARMKPTTAPSGGGDAETHFNQAMTALEAGRRDDAEAGLKSAIAHDPGHGNALHVLGLLRYQAGMIDDALEYVSRATAAEPGNAAFRANYATILNAAGRGAEAEVESRRALDVEPGNVQAHVALGTALMAEGKFEDAATALSEAAATVGDSGDLCVCLGNALRHCGRLDDAVDAYRRAVAVEPGNALAQSNFGAALREKGDLDAAETACRKAVEIFPGFAEGHNNLGNVLLAKGDQDAAAAAFRAAIGFRPGYAEAYLNLGSAYYATDRLADSEAAYREGLEAHPGHAHLHNGLGLALLAAGRLEEAVACFRRALRINPALAEAAYNLASSRTASLEAEEISALEGLSDSDGAPDRDRVLLHFALGDVRDGAGEPGQAFPHFQKGNALRRELLAAEDYHFNADDHDRRIERIMDTFDAAYFSLAAGRGVSADVPVFIVGMPRSGTTLVEQIAASHGQIHGAGELDEIPELARALARIGGAADFPDGLDAVAAGECRKQAQTHIHYLNELGGGAARVIDKSPFNYLYLGLIAALFPGARVIHCVRDARDLCLSCYFQNFVPPYPWSTDLSDLARYHRAYARLMDHWRRVLPLEITDISYEKLVADQEGISRRLIDALGVSWDDACLRYFATGRAVKTASNWQVRRPIYGRSVGRWRAYEEYLGPLLDGLNEG